MKLSTKYHLTVAARRSERSCLSRKCGTTHSASCRKTALLRPLLLGLTAPELVTRAPFAVPAQLLVFYAGIKKGRNSDHPRNLSRVVILD